MELVREGRSFGELDPPGVLQYMRDHYRFLATEHAAQYAQMFAAMLEPDGLPLTTCLDEAEVLALGAILAFALRVDLSGIDLQLVGWILMIVGALGIVLEVAVWGPRSRRRVTHSEGYAAPPAAAPPAAGPVQRTTTDETY